MNSSLNNFTHYLNVIIPAEHYQPNPIFLDGQSLQSLALECVAIVHDGQIVAYGCQVEVNATTHTLSHGIRTGVLESYHMDLLIVPPMVMLEACNFLSSLSVSLYSCTCVIKI